MRRLDTFADTLLVGSATLLAVASLAGQNFGSGHYQARIMTAREGDGVIDTGEEMRLPCRACGILERERLLRNLTGSPMDVSLSCVVARITLTHEI